MDSASTMAMATSPAGGDPAPQPPCQGGLLELIDIGEADPAVTDERDAYAANRAAERQARQLSGQRGRVDQRPRLELVRVQRHHSDDDLDLVAQPFDEARTQRPVDQPTGEDRALGWTSRRKNEPGNAACGMHPLFDVHRRGRSRRPRAACSVRWWRTTPWCRRLDRQLPIRRLAGPARARFEPDDMTPEIAVVDNGLGELKIWSLHGIPFYGAWRTGQCGAWIAPAQ